MYSFEPSEEQKMLVDAIRRYASTDLRGKAYEADEAGELSRGLIEKGWEMGLLQASIPEEYGGFGEHSAVTGVLAAEELAYGDLAGALAVMTPGLYALPILLAGTEDQKQEYIPPVIEADWRSFTAGLVETRFDFDPYELATTATQDNGHYVIQGEKSYVPFAREAEGMILYANLEGKTQGFIVPKGTPGLDVEERQKLLGIQALPVYRVCANGVRVPKENRLGGEAGHDFAPIMDSARVAMAALGTGMSRAAFDYARDYAKDRDVFGVKAAQKQAIAFMLAEMATEIEAIRLLLWEAAWKMDVGKEDAGKEAYLAHIGASDMAMMVSDRAVQILGGHGYIREHPVERYMRNGRGIATLAGLALV
jgi:acyl-CoA dehydrogenase